MSGKIIVFIILFFAGSFLQAGVLKSDIYDFEGLPTGQAPPSIDGFYTYGDASFQVSENPLGYSGMTGNTSLLVNLQGTSGYAGVGRGISRFIEISTANDKLNLYLLNTSSVLSFTVYITEDDNNDGIYEDSADDKFQQNVTLQPSSGWQLVSLPLSSFTDANAGGNGLLDIGYINNKGRLFNIELHFNTSAMQLPQRFYMDMISFSEGDLPLGISITDRPPTQNGDYCRLGACAGNSSLPEDIPTGMESLFSPPKQIKYVNTFLSFSDNGTHPDNYPGTGIETLLQKGYRPVITLEPFFTSLAPLDSAQPRLKDIIAGTFDSYYNTLANIVKGYSDTVYIRPMHEFDGNWYPWCISENGGDTALYISAYRHIVDIFRSSNVTNVKWMWCPNDYPAPVASYNWFVFAYPGTDYVDVVGTNIYNHPLTGTPPWRTFRYLLSEAYYYEQKYFPGKELFIFETGCRERDSTEPTYLESKAGWINEMDKELRSNFHRVRGMMWFNTPKEHAWQLNSSASSQTSFSQNIWQNNYYFNGVFSAYLSSEISSFKIFPNPTAGAITISTGTDLQNTLIEIYTTLGKRMMSFNALQFPFEANISSLIDGIYFLKFYSGSLQSAQKLVVSR